MNKKKKTADTIREIVRTVLRGNKLYDARVKSLKPRCACTGVVLWLNDPPRYEHKSGA